MTKVKKADLMELGMTSAQALKVLKSIRSMEDSYADVLELAAMYIPDSDDVVDIGRSGDTKELLISFVNRGDTYATTLCFVHNTSEFYVGSWGAGLEEFEASLYDDIEPGSVVVNGGEGNPQRVGLYQHPDNDKVEREFKLGDEAAAERYATKLADRYNATAYVIGYDDVRELDRVFDDTDDEWTAPGAVDKDGNWECPPDLGGCGYSNDPSHTHCLNCGMVW